MPEDDPLIDLGIRVTFVVDAKGDGRTNLDPETISKEVDMARNFLKSLPLLVYFSTDEQAQKRARLTSRGLWNPDNTPSERVIRQLAEGQSLVSLFSQSGNDSYEIQIVEGQAVVSRFSQSRINAYELLKASSNLTFEIDEIHVGNSIGVRANAKGRRSLANKRPSWTRSLKAIAVAIAGVASAAAGGSTISLLVVNNYPPGEYRPSPGSPTSADVGRDPRYRDIMQNLTHRDTCQFAVEEIQRMLRNLGFKCEPDGIPGDQTRRAVGEFTSVYRVVPVSDDWRDENFIHKLVEETIRSEREGAQR